MGGKTRYSRIYMHKFFYYYIQYHKFMPGEFTFEVYVYIFIAFSLNNVYLYVQVIVHIIKNDFMQQIAERR